MFISARLVLVALICVGFVGCSGRQNSAVYTVEAAAAQRSLPPDPQVGIRSEVYAALLSGMGYHGVRGSEMLVRDEWITIPAISDSAVAEWLEQIDAIPVQLRDALRRPAELKPGPVDRSLFPTGTRFISGAAIDAVFTQPLLDSWTAFKRQYKSEGWVSFSDVVVTSDGLDALVYSEAHCGRLCGEGVYIWLHRTGPGAPWSIVEGITSWIA